MESHRIPPPDSCLYQEFVRSNNLSVGVYRLEPGATDGQQPHAEDELYYVLQGKAGFTSGAGTLQVEPGFILFVPAGESHRFHDVTERLELLVIFGPAEGSRTSQTYAARRLRVDLFVAQSYERIKLRRTTCR